MDFMKWISSLDEFLYEVMSWLLFFPLTLWRAASRPLSMMDYADQQLSLPQEEQYSAALSPPLFLAIALLIGHIASVAMGEADTIVTSKHGMAGFINDETSALVLRVVLFASFPLFAAARLVRRQGLPLDRTTLRLPFYAQCYPAAVFALGLTLGISLSSLGSQASYVAAALIVVSSLVYYAVHQTRWFAQKLGIGYFRAAGNMVIVLFEGLGLFLFVGVLFSR